MINNYLNHQIIISDYVDGWIEGICEKCNIEVFYYIKQKMYLEIPINHTDFELYLTCEEQIIKNLLE
jgi:hypothetical protein